MYRKSKQLPVRRNFYRLPVLAVYSEHETDEKTG